MAHEHDVDNSTSTNFFNIILRTYGYILVGILLTILNLFMFQLILLKKTFRESYIVLAFAFFNNGLTGLFSLITGIKRAKISSDYTVPHYWCFLEFGPPFLDALRLANSLSLLMHSVDRLLVVLSPIKYFRDGFKYALCLIIAQYVITTIIFTYATIVTIAGKTRQVNNICSTHIVFERQSYMIILAMITINSIASILVMLAVVRFLKIRTARVTVNGGHGANYQIFQGFLKRQERYTITSVVSCVITLFIFVIPSTLQFLSTIGVFFPQHETYIVIIAVHLCLLNSFNLSITFIYRQEDIQAMVLSYICGKKYLSQICQISRQVPVTVGAFQMTTRRTAWDGKHSLPVPTLKLSNSRAT